jgi:hypothetical protein
MMWLKPHHLRTIESRYKDSQENSAWTFIS